MNKLKTFFQAFISSITSPAYYAKVLQAKFSFSFKYAVVLAGLLSCVGIAKIIVPLSLFPVTKSLDQLISNYPADLVVNIDQGKVLINQPYPYLIKMPIEWKTAQAPTNLIVFDSDQSLANGRSYADYNSLLVITQTSIYLPPDQTSNQTSGQDNVISIPTKTQKIELSQGEIFNWEKKFKSMPIVKYRLYLPLFAVILLIITWPILIIVRYLTALFYAIDTFVIMQIFKRKLLHGQEFAFRKVFQISLHSLTLPSVLAVITSFFVPDFFLQGFVYFGIYLAYTLYILNRLTMLPMNENSQGNMVMKKIGKSKIAAKG